MSAPPETSPAANVWRAMNSIEHTTKSAVHLPGLNIKLFEATTFEFHELLIEPSSNLQIGYLFDSVAEERNVRFPEIRGVAHFSPLGSLYVVPPNTAFGTRCGPINGTGVLCHVDASRYGAILDQDLWRRADVLEAAINIRSPEMKRVMGEIAREVSHSGRERELAIESLVSLALVHLGRYIGDHPTSQGTLPAWRVKRVEEMVREHLGKPLQVGDIAQSCGTSSSHLMRAYKRTTGRTIGQLIEDVRIERAKSLLREGDRTVTDIAQQLNYSSRPHFAAAFRRAEGISPLGYRQTFARPVYRQSSRDHHAC